jgi:hypothetical protein
MSRLRKILGLDVSAYDRPNQPWVCGHNCSGRACQLGPDKQGKCQATGECLPRRAGDRWHCTRTPELGGPCPGGPNPDGTCACAVPPCQPVRTLRSRRGIASIATVAVTIGALFFILGGRSPDRWISPGPLTAAHATTEAACSSCHQISGDAATSGIGRLIANHPATSARCVACHDLGTQPLLPHGRPANAFNSAHDIPHVAQSGSTAPLILAAARIARSPITNVSIECTTCHNEHRGRDSELNKIDDHQCQVCHQATFKSFAQGHPDFGNYPYKRRTRIIFDHASHLQKHFLEPGSSASAPTSCLDCHIPADTQGKMLVKSFAKSCAACHDSQIQGAGRAGAKGIAFFAIPGLDVKTLEAKGHSIGQWPEFAEGPLNPFIKLLLSSDPTAVADLSEIGGLNLIDLAAASDRQLDAAARTAWRIKSLFFDLTTEGQSALIKRLEAVSGRSGVSPAMIAQLPGEALLAAKNAWWPDLFIEIPNFRRGTLPPLPVSLNHIPSVSSGAEKPKIPAGDDNILDDAPAAKPAVKSSSKDSILDDDILGPAKTSPVPAATGRKPANDDILGDTIVVEPASTPAVKPPHPTDDILGDLGDATPSSAPPPAKSVPVPKVTLIEAEEWVSSGGWYRPDAEFILYYRPGGHADPFIKAWIDAAGHLADENGKAVLKTIAAPKSPGLCIKCHSVDETPEGKLITQWEPARFDPRKHEATKFNHTAHFSLLSEHGCQTCHVLAPQNDYRASYAETTPVGTYHSNFQALAKATCASCHQSEIAGESCQLCHNYHQGLISTGKLHNASTQIELPPAIVPSKKL